MKYESGIVLVICTLLWIYLWLRAIQIPFTYDEASTFQRYIHTLRFLPPGAHPDANNHILNSALSSLCYRLFGSSELSLRLPNLFAAPVFFYFWYQLSKEIKNLFFRWVFMLSFFTSLYFIEFFSVCRGYGISMAFFAASLFHLFRYCKSPNSKNFILCLVFMVIAVSANLTLINTFILIILLLGFSLITKSAKGKSGPILSHSFLLFLVGIFPVFLFSSHLLTLEKFGQLYYGSRLGFWNLTVKSLAAVITESHNILFPLYAVVSFLLCLLIFLKLNSRKISISEVLHPKYHFFILLTGNIAATLLVCFLTKSNYPEDRTGLYFFPLLVGSICFLGDAAPKGAFKTGMLALCLPLLLLPGQFLVKMNISKSSYYHLFQLPYRFYDKINSYQKSGETPLTIGSYRMRLLNWYFMIYRKGGNMQPVHVTDYPNTIEDFLITEMLEKPPLKMSYDSIDFDPASAFFLLKRKKFLERKPILDLPNITISGNLHEFCDLLVHPADSFVGKNIIIGFDLSIECKTAPLEAWIVCCAKDKDGRDLRYEFIALDWLKTNWSGEKHNFINGMLLNTIPPETKNIVAYFWNQKMVPFVIKDGRCIVSILQEDN